MSMNNSENLTITVKKHSFVTELISRHPDFNFIKQRTILNDKLISFYRTNYWSYDLTTIFIGKTGYGKSSLINQIIGDNLFQTDSLTSCTKSLQCADYKLNHQHDGYISFTDLPGIGESINADEKYKKSYIQMIEKAAVVVYVLRADQRDFIYDLEIINQYIKDKTKILIALNYADKIEPLNRTMPFALSIKQLENIIQKVNEVNYLFKVKKTNIIPISVTENYNINHLIRRLCTKLSRSRYLNE